MCKYYLLAILSLAGLGFLALLLSHLGGLYFRPLALIVILIIGSIAFLLFRVLIQVRNYRSFLNKIMAEYGLKQTYDCNLFKFLSKSSVNIRMFVEYFEDCIVQERQQVSLMQNRLEQLKESMEALEQGRSQSSKSETCALNLVDKLQAQLEGAISMSSLLKNSSLEQYEKISQLDVALGKITSKTNALSSTVDLANDAVSRLEGEVMNIASALGVINGIAKRTNLLALNAAIEASRAGNFGKGFAVVADEVRVLAQKTQESTIQIQGVLTQLQSGSEEAVNIMFSGQEQSGEVAYLTNQALEELSKTKSLLEMQVYRY